MPKIFRQPFFVFVSLVVIVILAIFLNIIGLLSPLKDFASFVTLPVNESFSWFGSRLRGFFSFFSEVKNLARENKELDEKVKELEAENAKLKETERENNLLREQLDYKKQSEHKLLPAFISGFDPNNLLASVTINRGEKDGAKKGAAVLASKGVLIGQVQEVKSDVSLVLLIIDGHSAIPALVQDSQADGVVKGEHGLGLIMDKISQDKVIKKGDKVITSGLGGTSVPFLVIGEVEEILSMEDELFQRVRVKSPVNFKELESVYVVLE